MSAFVSYDIRPLLHVIDDEEHHVGHEYVLQTRKEVVRGVNPVGSSGATGRVHIVNAN